MFDLELDRGEVCGAETCPWIVHCRQIGRLPPGSVCVFWDGPVTRPGFILVSKLAMGLLGFSRLTFAWRHSWFLTPVSTKSSLIKCWKFHQTRNVKQDGFVGSKARVNEQYWTRRPKIKPLCLVGVHLLSHLIFCFCWHLRLTTKTGL